jgi:hypothetical protein
VHDNGKQRLLEDLIKEEIDDKKYDEFEDNEQHWSKDGDYVYDDDIIECAVEEGEMLEQVPWGNLSFNVVL